MNPGDPLELSRILILKQFSALITTSISLFILRSLHLLSLGISRSKHITVNIDAASPLLIMSFPKEGILCEDLDRFDLEVLQRERYKHSTLSCSNVQFD